MQRLHELQADHIDDPDAHDEFDRVLEQIDRATEVIADYAGVLTTYLPTLHRVSS